MPHRVFYNVDLTAWVYGTIEKHRGGKAWRPAWIETYKGIGGVSESVGEKPCPMKAAETLYQLGRLKRAGVPFTECEIPELWNRTKNGTYAVLATRLLRSNPDLNKTSLWLEIKRAVRREIRDVPATTNQGGPTLAFQLWHLGLIVDESA